ncbi:MAG: DNA helicase RecG [Candidatus Moranbacteria bacterium CG_4_9_14_3_um_filter_40_7]|nr:MAG: DNA helicase RecG [Candidatus Moranbacteria bacterium CG_4_9_14_3_um_filter_40_7]
MLEKLGLLTVRDLLFYFPSRYDDFSRIVPIAEKYLDQVITVEGQIVKAKLTRIFRRKLTLFEIIIQDKSHQPLKALWFNQPYLAESLKEGVVVRLSGKMTLNKKFLFLSNPAWEMAQRESTNTGRIVPIYRETKGLTSKWLRWKIKEFLPCASQLTEIIPAKVAKKFHLYDFPEALNQIHFPKNSESLVRAQKTFAFQEMLLIQIKSLRLKKDWETHNSLSIKFDVDLIKKFVNHLPFKLTDAQRKSSFEILKDLESPRPMNRLLNGDVGSGKTIVAAIAALQTIQAGHQVALMAPTEVLARQHFESFSEIFKNNNFNIALLTNSYRKINNFEFRISNFEKNSNFQNSNFKIDSKFNPPAGGQNYSKLKTVNRKILLSKIKLGSVNLLIGTHALIQKDVCFQNLALAIIDEQHRFGVAQRASLQQSALELKDGSSQTIPHLLTLTATPIPRTLAIAFSGNLDISLLDEMPKNRQPIITQIIPPAKREEAYAFLKKQILSGRQAFVILPLVEESPALSEIKAATEEYKKLAEKIFPDLKIGLLHGRLKSAEKEKVMNQFKNRDLDILVATSVVEVGIDIPNATIILIEDAERFGLSQLHQFRGRVGRGEHQSYCLLFTNSDSAKSLQRLKVLAETNDGFAIAEKDLRLRGPGQFFGTLQSGLPDIAMENLTNIKLIKFAQAEAKNILTADPELKEHLSLKKELEKFQEKIHWE